MRKILFAVLPLVGLLSNLGYAAAQTGPTGPTTPPGGPIVPPAATANGISETDMLNFLRTLDPNVKMQKSKDGKTTEFAVNLNRDGWRYQLQVVLSERGLVIYAPLATIANAQSVPSQALAQLLKANVKMTTGIFAMAAEQDGRLQLVLAYWGNRSGMNTTVLNNVIVRFCNDLRQSYPAWSAVANASK